LLLFRYMPPFVRNFSIIAHIDHGKTTLSDRLLEATGALEQREMSDQVLDAMDLERERGITIKMHAVRLYYKAKDGQDYILNLIDTPGHVDFSYEVSRSLSACEGALLVVDASQGVEAQTLATAYLAVDHNLELIPVINKIDLPGAEPEQVRQQIEHSIGLGTHNVILASAKTGIGIDEILEAIVRDIPPPSGLADAPVKALIFDSWFDPYRGAVVMVRVIDGELRRRMKIRLMAKGSDYEIEDLGVLTPKPREIESLGVGEVGFVVANIKTVADVSIGDTITEAARPTLEPFPGFHAVYKVENVPLDRLNTFDQRPRPTPAPSTIRIRIVNASGHEDYGVAVKRQLEELGFVVTEQVESAVIRPAKQSRTKALPICEPSETKALPAIASGLRAKVS